MAGCCAVADSGGGGGGPRGLGPHFFFANALARGKSVAPCCIMCACACVSELFIIIIIIIHFKDMNKPGGHMSVKNTKTLEAACEP